MKVSDLVSLLCTNADSKYYQHNEINLRSFLSQVFNGGRKPPTDLKESIAICISAAKGVSLQQITNEVDACFLFLTEAKKNAQAQELNDVKIADGNDYDLFIRCLKKAETVSIITAEPAEVKNNTIADRLKFELLKKVGIVDSEDVKANYCFYLSELGLNNTPLNFWEGLYRYASNLLMDDVYGKFVQANGTNLKVFIVPDDEIDVTHGVIDEDTPQKISFISIYNKIKLSNLEELNVIREENGNLLRVLKKLERLKNLPAKKEFTFEEAMNIIHR